jgi:cytochrome c
MLGRLTILIAIIETRGTMGGVALRRLVTGTMLLWGTLAAVPTVSQAEDLLKNADSAYGEYLAGECVTCHSADGADKGIPNIIGVDAEGFAYMMHSYRKKELENKVMQLIAGRLDDEQIASLAVYFAALSTE